MPGFGGIQLQASGFEEQIRKLRDFAHIAEPHIRQALQESVQVIGSGWRQVAAEGETGDYRGSIAGRVTHLAGFRGLAIVETRAGSSGFPYPARLESSDRYHYRSGSQKGQRTKGKVRGMFRARKQDLLRKVEQAIQKVVNWLAVR